MVDRIGRADFYAELGRVWQPGQHLSAIGPTQHGKTTLTAELVPHLANFDTIAILTPKGLDQHYLPLGKLTDRWPPKRGTFDQLRVVLGIDPDPAEADAGPRIWRVYVPVRAREDWAKLRGLYQQVLNAIIARREYHPERLLVICDETRFMCDPKMLGLWGDMAGAIVMAATKNVSVANLFQAPRWVPRETLDQIVHGLSWKNRDRDVAKRLAEISGEDPKMFLGLLEGLGWYECLWVDGTTGRVFIVADK